MQAFGRESIAQLFRDDIAGRHGYCLRALSAKVATGFSDQIMRKKVVPGKKAVAGTAVNARGALRFCGCQVLKVPSTHPHNRNHE
jgi:hypothetical protein